MTFNNHRPRHDLHKMAMSCRHVARSCARQIQSASTPTARVSASRAAASIVAARRYNSTEAAAASPKISGIVDQISQLTLLETADLVSSLKVGARTASPSDPD